MIAPADIVFLFDVDNTLLDNDRVTDDLRQHLVHRDAVEGRVLIYIRKERMLEAVQARYPARRYVMVDDELRILAAERQRQGTQAFDRSWNELLSGIAGKSRSLHGAVAAPGARP